MVNKYLTALITILLSGNLHATHILGGYISYKPINANTIGITVIVYRDCNSATVSDGTLGSTSGLNLGLYTATGDSLIDFYSLINPTIDTISNPPFCVANSFCIEKAEYYYTWQLPDSSIGYKLVWQRCCFASSFTNVLSSVDQGITFYVDVAPLSMFANNSPLRTFGPDFYAKPGQPYLSDASFTDTDGDSLSYTFFCPATGGGPNDPAPFPAPILSNDSLIWASGFSESNVTGLNNILINETTGLISYSPLNQGIYFIPVLIHEYRNRVEIGSLSAYYTVYTTNDCSPLSLQESTTIARPRLVHKEGYLTIDWETLNDYPIEIQFYDLRGALVKKDIMSNENESFDIRENTEGIYVAQIKFRSGQTFFQKILIDQ